MVLNGLNFAAFALAKVKKRNNVVKKKSVNSEGKTNLQSKLLTHQTLYLLATGSF